MCSTLTNICTHMIHICTSTTQCTHTQCVCGACGYMRVPRTVVPIHAQCIVCWCCMTYVCVLVPRGIHVCMVHCVLAPLLHACAYSTHACLAGWDTYMDSEYICTACTVCVCRAHRCAKCCRSCTDERTELTGPLRPMSHTSGSMREPHTHRKPAWAPSRKH